jgi:hypothetical protein
MRIAAIAAIVAMVVAVVIATAAMAVIAIAAIVKSCSYQQFKRVVDYSFASNQQPS